MSSFLVIHVTTLITVNFFWQWRVVESNVINCDANNPTQCISNTIQCPDNNKECDIFCNTAQSCSGSSIRCPLNHKCSVNCKDHKSCDGTSHYKMTINCPNNADCNIYCDSWSCPELIINCPNNGICNIYGNNSHSLFWSHIYCHSSNECNIKCNGYSSCQQSTIYGQNTKQLNIECNQERSCIDMDIYCPENTSGNKRCKIIGSDLSHRGRHSYLRFYAINSWNDVDITEYNAYTMPGDGNRMICTESLHYLCIFSLLNTPNPSSNWNCSCPGPEIYPTVKPTISPDIILNNSITIAPIKQDIICNNDTNICVNTTVLCDANVTECNVYCNTFESCVGSVIQCPINNYAVCNIYCIGVKSCNSLNEYTVLKCQGDNCNIGCIGYEACISSNIECNGECNIISSGINALSYANIRCDITAQYNCFLQCNANFGCQQITVRGILAKGLYINCNGKASCKNMNIRCPPAADINNVSCIVSGHDESVHTWLTIFAINGWSDISGGEYIMFIDNSLNSDNRIYCGDRFDAHCTIISNSRDDKCECIVPTQSPTIAQPTSAPTFSPTISPTEVEVIVGASIAFYVTMVVAFVLTVLFCVFLVIGSKKEDKIYEQYLELKKSLKKQKSINENE